MIELDEILAQVYKPGRYIGQEWNIAKKDFDKAEIKFALCFPDLYEVGMSNLGIRIIYGLLNSLIGVSCERFFSPDLDMENILRLRRQEIFSLESQRKLKDFDLVGFSLGYELNYTNVLNILDLGGIPLRASLRDRKFPLIIGGGPCTMNPEPMHDFFDFFLIGEAEEALPEAIEVYRKYKDRWKSGKISKEELLVLFSQVSGVYAPSLYEVQFSDDGKIRNFSPRFKDINAKISKRFVQDLDRAYFPLDWLLPYIAIVHDRITLEIMRGCPNHCRFCQARSQYYPFRLKDKNNILGQARALYKSSGYEDISLSGLSVSEYPDIEGLLKELVDLFKKEAVGISLPSIRPEAMTELSFLISMIKKTGFTFAPEAATEKLRRILNKDFDVAELFRAIERAYSLGWQHIKLYFMIGIPHEEESDLGAILDFAVRASEARRRINNKPGQVNLSVNALIPKPHTSFQWLAMEGLESIKRKQNFLRKKINHKRLKLSFHNPEISFLEGVFSRGDRRLSQVVLGAFARGARFDAWDKYFNLERWLSVFKEAGLDPESYLKEKAIDEHLPWDFLYSGISKEVLLLDYEKIIAQK